MITSVSRDPGLAHLREAIRAHPRFLLTSHARPDGDAIGSVLALSAILRQLGHQTAMVLADPVPYIYRNLPGVDEIRLNARIDSVAGFETSPCILLECDSFERSGLAGFGTRPLLNIDHHLSGRRFGEINWIDPDACAVAAMVFHFALEAGAEITPEIATCLYTAILSDTGAFTYGGTNAETFAIAHDLARRGAHPGHVARQVFFSNPESKLRVLGTALSKMQREGPLAWTSITVAEIERAGAAVEDCEGIVNYLISIAGVESAVFLRELPDSADFRLSLRSKGRLNVAEVAESFGGGGHQSASGCTLAGPLDHAAERILTELRSGLC